MRTLKLPRDVPIAEIEAIAILLAVRLQKALPQKIVLIRDGDGEDTLKLKLKLKLNLATKVTVNPNPPEGVPVVVAERLQRIQVLTTQAPEARVTGAEEREAQCQVTQLPDSQLGEGDEVLKRLKLPILR